MSSRFRLLFQGGRASLGGASEPTGRHAGGRRRRPSTTRAVGARAERRARRHYRLRGYRILDANVWAGGNELDLVVRRGRHVTFVEVKAKSSDRRGDPLDMVGPEKQRRLRRAAEAWLGARPELRGLRLSFDVVAFRGGKLHRVRGAF